MPDFQNSDRKERLAAAKRKLKSFQNQRHLCNENQTNSNASRAHSVTLSHGGGSIESLGAESSKSTPAFNGMNLNLQSNYIRQSGDGNTNYFHHNEETSPFERVRKSCTPSIENNQTYGAVGNNDFNNVISTPGQDFYLIQEENEQLKNYCTQLTSRLEELNKHYAQLHSAYVNLSCKSTFDTTPESSLGSNDLKRQVEQNLQTITVLVQEKADLQSQLKQTWQIANEKCQENEKLKLDLNIEKNKLVEFERNLDDLKTSNKILEQTFSKQHFELNEIRRDNARLQVQSTENLQDKSEARAKLKQKSIELNSVLSENEELKKKLAMSEIYLQQLSAPSSQDATWVLQREQLTTLNEQISLLQQEKDQFKVALQQSEWREQQSKERDEFLARQMRQKIEQLTNENELLQTQNNALISNSQTLPPINVNTRVNEDAQCQKDDRQNLELDKSLAEVEHLKNELLDNEKSTAEIKELLAQKERRLEQLEEYISSNRQTLDFNSKNLLDQLHNEKAATSRCTSQNLLLKKQLEELEQKFVAITHEQMDLATKIESLEYNLKLAQDQATTKQAELEKQTLEFAQEKMMLKNQVNQSLRNEYDRNQLEDRLKHYCNLYENCQHELQTAKNNVQILSAELDFFRNKKSEIDDRTNGHREDDGLDALCEPRRDAASTFEMDILNRELQEIKQRLHRVSSENEELHRIMEQNSTDENQNTIHVDLSRAVERCATLAEENQNLKRTAQNLITSRHQNEKVDKWTATRLDFDDAFIGHFEKKDEEPLGNLKMVVEKLQERLKKALDQNANLHDKNEQLEHLIIKLQSETDTIGEYVTLYQHQRQVIREKLKEKDEYVSKLSGEHAAMQTKLIQLQILIVELLKQRNVITSYNNLKILKGQSTREVGKAPSKITPRPKTLSETLIDETIHQQNNHSKSRSPSAPLTHFSTVDNANQMPSTNSTMENNLNNFEQRQSSNVDDTDADNGAVDKILKILAELQQPNLINHLPPVCDKNLHCNHCTGHMIVI